MCLLTTISVHTEHSTRDSLPVLHQGSIKNNITGNHTCFTCNGGSTAQYRHLFQSTLNHTLVLRLS